MPASPSRLARRPFWLGFRRGAGVNSCCVCAEIDVDTDIDTGVDMEKETDIDMAES